MFETKAVFRSKEPTLETWDCTVSEVVMLSGAEFDSFSRNLLRDQDFIMESNRLGFPDDRKRHVLLVMGEGRKNGILVDSQGYNYARYTAHIPNAEAFLLAERYPALAEFNKKLAAVVDFIAENGGAGNPEGRGVIELDDEGVNLGIDFMTNPALRSTLFEMLNERLEIRDWELDKNELIVYRDLGVKTITAKSLSDPTVTPTDMYAYGYAWDGMIPLSKERALELHDQGHEVFRLYENNAEGVADCREDIETFDGLFGTENPDWKQPEQETPFQVFIINREKYDKGEAVGEWLMLPADVDTLQGLLERIGIEKPSEGAYTVTAVRMPLEDYVRDYISKYDSIDELNMLASYMSGFDEPFYFEKLKAILSSGVAQIGSDAAALINLLDEENFTAFDFIYAHNEEQLGRYYADENNEKPDDVSYEDYGRECVKEEGGRFFGDGYIKHMHKEVTREYDGVVPDEYKIVGNALVGLRSRLQERANDSDGKPSVLDEIKAARQTTPEPRESGERTHRKNMGEVDL